jgi:hypothetical protein
MSFVESKTSSFLLAFPSGPMGPQFITTRKEKKEKRGGSPELIAAKASGVRGGRLHVHKDDRERGDTHCRCYHSFAPGFLPFHRPQCRVIVSRPRADGAVSVRTRHSRRIRPNPFRPIFPTHTLFVFVQRKHGWLARSDLCRLTAQAPAAIPLHLPTVLEQMK